MDGRQMGAFLARLRREKGWTQEELGEKVFVTGKTISRWETGTYLPGVDRLVLLAGALGVTLNELVRGERLEGEGFRAAAEENLSAAMASGGALARLGRWLGRRGRAVLAGIALLALVWAAAGVETAYRREHPADVSLPGTFAAGEAPDQTYLAFVKGGSYCRYRQFEPLERGTWTADGELVTVTAAGESRQLLLKGRGLYDADPATGRVTRYEKFSDIGVFINVEEQ